MRGRLVARTWTHDPSAYAPPRHRRACRYETFEPDGLGGFVSTLTDDAMGVVSDAERVIGRLNAAPLPAHAPLARLLLRTESIASSKVEGLAVDARALARAEARSDLGVTVGSQARDVLANIDAMQLAVEDADAAAALGIRQIGRIHAALMATGGDSRHAGVVRTTQNWIGGNDHNPCGAAFVPPPPEMVEPLLADLAEFMAAEHLSPIVQAAISHAQFETIHPFADGNGRTGRALIHAVLRRRGLAPAFTPPISVVLARRRDSYIAGLSAFREDRVSDWIETFATAAAEAGHLATAYLERVGSLQETWRERLRAEAGPRSDAAAWRVIDVLPAYPVITVAIAAAATGRTRPAVNQAIAVLAAAGVLVPLTASRRNRSWEAAGLLELMDELEERPAGSPQ